MRLIPVFIIFKVEKSINKHCLEFYKEKYRFILINTKLLLEKSTR